jgi:penicillin amidase
MARWLAPLILLPVITPQQAAGEQEKFNAESLREQAAAVLPRLDGEIMFPVSSIRAPRGVEIVRDRYGIPHIFADDDRDLFFAQGFVAAQDRLFQIDWWRRVGNGETAEVLGKEALEADRFARLVKYRGDMDAEWASYSPDTREIAVAFTSGINAYIDHIGKKLPIEFQILGYAPKKWQPEDILGRMSGIIMSGNFQREVARARLIAGVGLDKARLLAPTDPVRPFAPAPGLDLTGIDNHILAGYRAATKAIGFTPAKTQSNNWVVDGTRSASGFPLLASDPHRAIALPSLRYMVHLKSRNWNVIGAGEPALPGIALGHNENIAWGITIVGTDQADVFVEETNPADGTEYMVRDRWEKMKIIRENVTVKGEKEPVVVELRWTRHGPVLYQDAKRNRAYALKWAGSEPGGAAYLGGLAVGRARNKKEFLAALKSWKIPSLNFAYAEKGTAANSTIGWVAGGLVPIRKKHDGLLPVPGNGGYEWQGFLPVSELPQKFNPPEGFVATANHNILPPGYQHEISYEFAPPYRFLRVTDRLQARKRFAREDFKSIQHDEISIPGQILTRLIKSVEIKDEALKPFAEMLTEWDGSLSRESRAGPLYAVWLQELHKEFYKPHVPKELLKDLSLLSGPPLLLAALEKPDKTWFGDQPQESRDQLLRTTFARAVERTQKLLPGDPLFWRWGKLHTVTFKHPLATLGQEYARAFNLGPIPRGGDVNTPNNTRYDDRFHQVHGATYRHLFDLADWDRGLATNAPGQSGALGSPFYSNLLYRWAVAGYVPLYYSRGKIEEAAKHRLRLRP